MIRQFYCCVTFILSFCICFFQVSFPSKVISRYFTSSSHGIYISIYCLTLFLRFEDRITFILVLLISNLLVHFWKSYKQFFMYLHAMFKLLFVLVIAVSSAYIAISIPGLLGMSLVKMLNNVGPSTEPCGTPVLISLLVDVVCSIITRKVLFIKKDCVISVIPFVIPICVILLIIPLCHVL